MFKYDTNEIIAERQQKETDEIFLMLAKHCNLYYSKKIDQILASTKLTFEYLVEFAELLKIHKQKITLIAVPRNYDYIRFGEPLRDIDRGFNPYDKSRDDLIPYIEYSFHEEYNNPHGARYNHCFFLFFTEHHEFEASEDYCKYWLEKINKLRTFL